MARRTLITATVLAGLIFCGALHAADADAGGNGDKWKPAVDPKPLSDNVKRGLGWLVEHQLESGAWGQGEESRHMGGGGKLKDTASVADTCMAAMALLRSGNTPRSGTHARAVLRAVNYVCAEIEKSDADSLFITATRGTRVQSKLGMYIDTFMAAMLLPQVQHEMPDADGRDRVSTALDKVLHKMQKNQREDGRWDDRGWAATLAQSVAVKGLNLAAQSGKDVPRPVLARASDESRKRYDKTSGTFAGGGSAGVKLYAAASTLGGQQDSVNTAKARKQELTADLETATAEPRRKEIQRELKDIEAREEDLKQTREAVAAKLNDKRFIAGFGSNGGEEFLSYMTIGESLVIEGGDAWETWDKSMTRNLNHIQNQDGSWTGHHCITGRTFCSSAALLVLMVDRAPVPVAAKIKK